jgi:hypothetical protein
MVHPQSRVGQVDDARNPDAPRARKAHHRRAAGVALLREVVVAGFAPFTVHQDMTLRRSQHGDISHRLDNTHQHLPQHNQQHGSLRILTFSNPSPQYLLSYAPDETMTTSRGGQATRHHYESSRPVCQGLISQSPINATFFLCQPVLHVVGYLLAAQPRTLLGVLSADSCRSKQRCIFLFIQIPLF